MDTQKIGKFIAEKRKNKSLTQVQLGEYLGVTGKTVSRWENGNYMPDISLLIPLSEVLEITLNELLNGEAILQEQLERKSEESITSTIEFSKKKIDKLKKRYLCFFLGIVLILTLSLLFLHKIFFTQVPYATVTETEWDSIFQNHSAYEIGMTHDQIPVFTEPAKAFKKAKSDYSDGINTLRAEYHLPIFSKYTYKWYIYYCNSHVSDSDMITEQLNDLNQFLTIYNNSFTWKNTLSDVLHDNQRKESWNMRFIQISLLLIALGITLIIVTICTEGLDFTRYFIYKGKATGTIISIEGFLVSRSRRLVEKQKYDADYVPIISTQDKSAQKFPFVYYNKMQATLQWNAENANWRARYPYMRKADDWNQNDTLTIHYSKKRPWKYAIADKQMWAKMCIKLILYIGLCTIGVLLLTSCI